MRKMAKPISGFEQSQLDRLYQELDRYTGLVETERAKSASMEKEIASLHEDILRRRREMGGVNAAANSRRLVEKQVRLLENKLDQALVKFNKCVSRNKELREEIDGLRGERVTFEKVSRKVEKELRSKKRQMNAIIEQSNQAYEQRDKAQLETAAIKRLNRAEETAHHQKIADLGEELDQINRDLLDSTTRAHTAVVVDPEEEERKEAEHRELQRANDILRAEEEYAQVTRQPFGLLQVLPPDSLPRAFFPQQRQEKLEEYEDAFRKIADSTNVSDVDELVKRFVENEEHNFSLFRYSSEQAAEIERLQEGIQTLHEEEMRLNALAGEDRADSGAEELARLEREIKAVDDQTAAYDVKCQRHKRTLEEVKDEVRLLLIRLDCKLDQEEGSTPLSTDNLIHFLGIIEERAVGIVSSYERLKEHDSEKEGSGVASPSVRSMFGRPSIPIGGEVGATAAVVNPPRLLDAESSDDDEDDESSQPVQPLHRNQLSEQSVQRISFKGSRRRTTIAGGNGRRGSLYGRGSLRLSTRDSGP